MEEQADRVRAFGRDMFEDFDIDDPAFNDHFTDVLDAFVAKCPVAHSKVGEGYAVINRYADVRAVGQDWKTFSSSRGFDPSAGPTKPSLYIRSIRWAARP